MRCLLRSLARVSVRFCFLIIEFQEFFVYFGNSLSSNVFCKHFPPVCGLSANSFDTLFWRAKVLILMKSSLSIISLMVIVFDVVSKKASLYLRQFPFMSLCSSELWLALFFYLSPVSSSLLWIQEELLLLQSVQFFFLLTCFQYKQKDDVANSKLLIWRTGNQKSLSSVNF